MEKLLVVCGPTATGKTEVALKLAEAFSGELVSADSRQVYKYMNIGTGKDIPDGYLYDNGYYTNRKIRIWGYDLVEPTEEFSVSQYIEYASKVILDIHSRGKLPILVGGTGLYIRGIVDGIGTNGVPKDEKLRALLSKLSVEHLQKKLRDIDPNRFEAMNSSDKYNSRRLIRAIEVAGYVGELPKSNLPQYDALFIGLTLLKDDLDRRISLRVDKRIKQGILPEIENLLQRGAKWDDQSMSSLGYRQWREYFEKKKALSDAILDWKKAERKYAKRQKTWFKKDLRIHWFNVSKDNHYEKLERLAKKWYKRSTDAKKN